MKRYQTMWIATMLVLLAGACGKEEAPVEETIRPVRSEEVKLVSLSERHSFSGTARAGVITKLSFRIGGLISVVEVKVGSRVAQGDLIASLDAADVTLEYEQALSSQHNARVGMHTAKANLERVKGLYESNSLSLSEYETAKANYAAAQSTYETSVKSTDLQRSQVGYTKLFAPMSGIIGAVRVERNESVSAGTTVAELNSEGDIEVNIGFPEAFITRAQVGMPVEVRFSAIPDRMFAAAVYEVSYVIDPETHTYPVTVKLREHDPRTRPGMAAEVTLDFADTSAKPRLVAPQQSVSQDIDGKYVFVVDAATAGEATVRRRNVEVGKLTGEGFEIVDGLTAGERVVTAGVEKMYDGLRVRPLN
ncbi:Efflux RND transporter periplasmic adaptor subunit [Sulfidibacter corallicola]|uniref:Efflux RND transporter periplasmic adaptor subunit n=1 Tax=Sulfidibacter corallicola TaxID=2818388 RepID=A0A8A4TRA7_SULCO|nr:efflux RND transporter periplasmic adaptor subunit [Sulfidibacter corallicola]QTD52053.1 efflux RND transporter periplasmic adaptor subunit [Sulfidibacter corallicola]